MSAFLPDGTRISRVHLRTADLRRSLCFYCGTLGFYAKRIVEEEAALATDGSSPEIIILSEVLDALSRPPSATGLYHLAIRYPQPRDLAAAYRRLTENDYPVAGASDHGVSEAIYLSDPDGNGLELYADRPRSLWPRHREQLAMTSHPLDLDSLLATTETRSTSAGPPPQTEIGHIHLRVASLSAAERFYHEFLGLAVTQRSIPGALFFAAGGYHHHIGVNTWATRSSPPDNATGLLSYRLEVPVPEVLYCLQHRAPLLGYETRMVPAEGPGILLLIGDPDGNWLEIQASAGPPSLDCSTKLSLGDGQPPISAPVAKSPAQAQNPSRALDQSKVPVARDGHTPAAISPERARPRAQQGPLFQRH